MKYLLSISKEVIEAVWNLVKAVLLPLVDLINYFKYRKKGGVN